MKTLKGMLERVNKFDLFVVGFFLVVPILFFGKLFFLSGNNRVFIGSDFIHYFEGFFYYVKQFGKGDFPFWNQHIFMGMPFFSRADLALLYPVNFLWALGGLFMGLNIKMLYIWYELYLMVHLSLGGIFCYFFAREIKISKYGSLLAGFFFMLSGVLLMLINAVPLITSSIWIPLVLLFYKRSLESNGRKEVYYALITALIMSVSHFAGYIQISLFYTGLSLLIFCVFFVITNNSSAKTIMRKLLAFMFISFISLAIYAVQLIPTFELLSHSSRNEISFHDSIFYGAMRPLQALDFLTPNIFRYVNDNVLVNEQVSFLYFGIIPIILFLFGILYSKNKYLSFFVIIFFVFLVSSFGGFTSLYEYMVMFIPKLDSFRNVNKILYLSAFAFSLVAGMGVDYIFKNRTDLKLKSFFTSFSLIAFLLVIVRVISISFPSNELIEKTLSLNIFDSVFILFLQILLAFLLFHYLTKTNKEGIFVFLIIALTFFDLSNFNSRTLPNNTHVDPYYYLGTSDKDCIACQIDNTEDFGRTIFVSGMYGQHYAPSVAGIYNAGGYCSFVLENSLKLSQSAHSSKKDGHEFVEKLAKMGVKYVVSGEEIANENLTLLNTEVVKSENKKSFFEYGGDTVGIRNKEQNKKEFLYLNNEFKGIISTKAQYKIKEFGSDRIKIDFSSSKKESVVIRMQSYPGWRVYVNEEEISHKSNVNGFISFGIEPGKSEVELVYKEKHFILGLAITVSALFVTVFLILKIRKDDKE